MGSKGRSRKHWRQSMQQGRSLTPAEVRARIRTGKYRLVFSSEDTEAQRVARLQQQQQSPPADLCINVADGVGVGDRVV